MVDVLDCFSKDRPAWSLSELSARLDLPKSTLHRFLVGLERHGLLRRGARGRSMAARPSPLYLGQPGGGKHRRPARRPARAARPGRDDGRDGAPDGVPRRRGGLHRQDRDEPLGADCARSRRTPRTPRRRLVKSAHGLTCPKPKSPPSYARRACRATASAPSPTRPSFTASWRGSASVATHLSYEETDQGAWGIATPVRNWEGAVVAALGRGRPNGALQPRAEAQRYVSLCCDAAAHVSMLLGQSEAALAATSPQDGRKPIFWDTWPCPMNGLC